MKYCVSCRSATTGRGDQCTDCGSRDLVEWRDEWATVDDVPDEVHDRFIELDAPDDDSLWDEYWGPVREHDCPFCGAYAFATLAPPFGYAEVVEFETRAVYECDECGERVQIRMSS